MFALPSTSRPLVSLSPPVRTPRSMAAETEAGATGSKKRGRRLRKELTRRLKRHLKSTASSIADTEADDDEDGRSRDHKGGPLETAGGQQAGGQDGVDEDDWSGLIRARAFSAPALFQHPPADHLRSLSRSSSSSSLASFYTSPASPASSYLSLVEQTLAGHPAVSFDSLPDEIQLLIFGWVRAPESDSDGSDWEGLRTLMLLGQVSRGFRALVLDGQLHPRFPTALLSPRTLYHHPMFLESLLEKCGRFLRDADFEGMAWIGVADWERFTAWCLHPEGYAAFATLNLSRCQSLTWRSLDLLLPARCPYLTRLDLSCLGSLRSHHLSALPASLRHIDISACPQVHSSALLCLPVGLIRLKMAHASRLGARADPRLLAKLVRRLVNLQTLDLAYSDLVTDGAVAAMTAPAGGSTNDWVYVTLWEPHEVTRLVLPTLRHLRLSGCSDLGEAGVSALIGSLPNVEILEVARIGPVTDATMARLVGRMGKLRMLDVEDQREMAGETMAALSFTASLTSLVANQCLSIPDLSFLQLVQQCPCLKHLEADLTLISEFTAREFVRVARQRREQGAVLSVSDNRSVGRRIAAAGAQGGTRPRHGRPERWARPFGYRGAADAGGTDAEFGGLEIGTECDETLVVVRSFYGSLVVDAETSRHGLAGAAGHLVGRGPTGLRELITRPRRRDGRRAASCIIM